MACVQGFLPLFPIDVGTLHLRLGCILAIFLIAWGEVRSLDALEWLPRQLMLIKKHRFVIAFHFDPLKLAFKGTGVSRLLTRAITVVVFHVAKVEAILIHHLLSYVGYELQVTLLPSPLIK